MRFRRKSPPNIFAKISHVSKLKFLTILEIFFARAFGTRESTADYFGGSRAKKQPLVSPRD